MPDGVWRIGDRRTFQALRVRGRRARVGPVTVVYLPADPDDRRVRLAFAIGRRVGSAVVRNRLRRRARAVVSDLVRSRGIPPGAYLVIVAPDAAQWPFSRLAETVAVGVHQAARAGERTRP